MIDYKRSVLAGIEASEEADRNRTEIKGVLVELDTAVSEATDGVVGIRVQQFRESTPSRGLFSGYLSTAQELANPPEPKWYQGIAVFRREGGSGIEVATWEESTSGYPVSIGSESGMHDCHDKESLERQLDRLLQTPTAGAAIRKSMQAAE